MSFAGLLSAIMVGSGDLSVYTSCGVTIWVVYALRGQIVGVCCARSGHLFAFCGVFTGLPVSSL